MVVQHGRPLCVWGWADPGEAVTVGLGEQSGSASAGSDGKWRITLPPLPPGGPLTMTVRGNNRLEVTDILAGDVWICCGQSNMEMPVGNLYRPKPYPGVLNFREEIARASHPQIRLFLPDHQTSLNPKDDLPGKGWQVCTPESAGRFSAVGYFFARHLHAALKVPIGMIQAAKSSTPAEAWTSLEGLRTIPQWAARLDKRKPASSHPPMPAAPADTPDPDNPPPPTTVEVPFGEPAGLFNGMIAPATPFVIRGAIFYQGENNAKDPRGYSVLFPTLIRSWRNAWGLGDFPFLFVQLAAYGPKPRQPREDGGWAAQREAQAAALKEPNTGMAVTIDIGSPNLIHPPNKQEVGRRLGLLAESIAYGRTVEARGPSFHSMKAEGGALRIRFDHTAGGLVAKPLTRGTPPTLPIRPTGFVIAGRDGTYHPADAQICGDEVVLSSPDVPQPVAARYAWAGNPDCNLYNSANLPAEPFRAESR